jgi:two-component system, cell cycle sensor histidine kinase and response regulator CckA
MGASKPGTPDLRETIMKDEEKSRGQLVHDMTELRLRVAELEESEAKYRLLVESADDAICITQQGVLRFVNPSGAELMGRPKEELLSKPFAEMVHPEDLEELTRLYLERLRDEYVAPGHRFRIITSDGGKKWVESYSATIIWEGQPAVLSLIRDVTRQIREQELLRHSHDELDQRFQERTAELREINEKLLLEIDERKKAEDSLRQSEKKYRLVVDNANEGIFLTRDGKPIFVNSMCSVLTGYSADELIAQPFDRLIHPDDRQKVAQKYARRLGGDQGPYSYRFRIITKDGHVKWVHLNSVVLNWENQPTVLGLVTDITDSVQAEELLWFEKHRFQTLAENAPVGMVMSGSDGSFGYINQKFKDLFGYDLNDVPNGRSWFRLAYPDPHYRKQVLSEWKEDMRRSQPGEATPRVFTVTCKDGARKTIHFRSVQLQTGERLTTCEDITDRTDAEKVLRESEKRYRTILETIAEGYHEVDLKGNLTLVNDSLCEIFGYPREELLGMNYRQLMDEPNAKSIFHAYNEVYKTGRSHLGFNYQIIRKEGSRRDASVSISLIKDADGQPIGFRGIMRDVTERRKLQEQLHQATKMEALGTLAGGIAHDFNNLLQIVLGYSDLLLLKKKKEDPDHDKLRAIRGAAQRGSDLVHQILTFSRKIETKLRPLDLNHEIRQIEQLLDRTIEKMVSIQINLAENLWTISADPIQIEQILLNLAVNAKHAMPQGGRLVIEAKNTKLDEQYCRTHLEIKPGRYVLLMVSDTGHGMEREVLERIFEPFFTTKKTGEGSGLGLATVFGIVKSHGGAITCYSEPGVGTTFKVHFPAIEGELESSAETTQEMPAFGTETLLVVDDEESIRELAKDLLHSTGYKVLTASTGREAVDIYSERQEVISLVILDLIMPEMDGSRCLQELLRINPLAKILVASGYSANGPAREAATMGARGYVSKPYNVRELLRMVRAVLDAE